MEVSHAIKVTREDIGSLFFDVFTSIQRGVIGYMIAIKKLRDKLLFESKIVDKEHKRDITDKDSYIGIKEVMVVAIFGTSFGVISRTSFGAIFCTEFGAISEITSTTISRVVVEIKLRKVEEGDQQFENECTK